MKAENKDLMTLDEFKDKYFGKVGTQKRDDYEAGFENFKIEALLHEARKEKGMTQLNLSINL